MTGSSQRSDAVAGATVSRRAALQALALGVGGVALSGCADDQRVRRGAPPGVDPARAGAATALDPDVELVRISIAEEELLGALYVRAARRYPGQRPLLDGLSARQQAHVARLRGSLTGVRPGVNQVRPDVPPLAELADALGTAALEARDARSAACLAATSGLLAELFGSMAASHAITVLLVEPAASAPTTSTTTSWPTTTTSGGSLQPCLAAEHAAVFGYAVLGGVLSAGVSAAPAAQAALAAYDVHRDRRDSLTALIAATGSAPVASAASYDSPIDVSGPASARRLAQILESRSATVYARATALTTGQTRLLTSGVLVDCAVRGARWGTAPAAFPGLT